MSELRALLLTEVVDGAALSAALGDMALTEPWASHDRAARDLLSACGGIEIDKTDGRLLLFAAAADAVAYALAYQRALAALPVPLQARAGLHVGQVSLRENSAADVARGAKPLEVDGIAKPTAARVMSLARGGQIFLTAEAREALGRTALRLQSHGHWLLKGVAEPLELFEVCEADAPFTAPTDTDKVSHVVRVGERWLPVNQVANNLPQQMTSLVGRAGEIDAVKQMLGRTRLLTLTGAGGCGKTRLALQVAAELLASYPDGVWLVELAALSDPGLVAQELAKVLGLKEASGKSLMQTVTEHLASRHMLLVLDNAEHLLSACGRLSSALLRECPQVVLLASSREGLGTDGELIYRVPSLSLPDSKREVTIENVSKCEAVRLFVERAQLHSPQFAVTRHNAPALASICERLDGIPLAIELAAARLRSLAIGELNSRLDQRFRLLTGGSRTALPRQQTLRALIDWSHDLLSPTDQALLRRLSVFVGGWTLAEAEQVCGAEHGAAREVVASLTALVDKSLVLLEERNGANRYRLPETVRQYARDRLLESGEGQAWRDRHLACFVSLAEVAKPELRGADQQAWLDRLEIEHDNLRAALTWSAAEGGAAAAGLRLAGALFSFWYVRGYLGEARSWLTGLLAAGRDAPAAARADALGAVGVMMWQQGDYPAARAAHEECLAVQRQLADRRGIATSLINLGLVDFEQDDYPAARARFAEGLAIRRELGNRRGVAGALHNLGAVAVACADQQAARTLFEEALQVYRDVGDPWGTAVSLSNLGSLACDRTELAAARSLHEESLAIRRGLGDRRGVAESLEGLAGLTFALASPERAARLWGASQWLREDVGAPLSPKDRAAQDRLVSAARSAINDDAAFERAWQEGRALTLAQAIEHALVKADT